MVGEIIKGWQQSQEVFRGHKPPLCDQMKHSTKTRISLNKTWAANLWNKMKTSTIMKSLLMLQQEAVPGESINNLVSREYEFYLPKRIRGTNFFFDVILSTYISAYVCSSHPSLSRSASTPPETLTSLLPQISVVHSMYLHLWLHLKNAIAHDLHHYSYFPCNYVS